MKNSVKKEKRRIYFLLSMLALLVLLTAPVSAWQLPSPNITAWHPFEPKIFNTEGETRYFSITVNQIVNVTWQIDGAVVQTNESVIFAELMIVGQVSPPPEHWNVSAIVENPNGTDTHTWVWSVAPQRFPPPEPTDFHVAVHVPSIAVFAIITIGLLVVIYLQRKGRK